MMEMMHLYGVGDHGGGPTRAMLDEGVHWMQPDQMVPKMQFGIAQGFFSRRRKEARHPDSPTWNYETLAAGDTRSCPASSGRQISIPTWNDELYFEFHRGVFTTQAEHKRNMRESEEWMLNAEKYVLAGVAGWSSPIPAAS